MEDFSTLTNWVAEVLHSALQYRYLTPEVAESFMLLLVPSLFLFVVGVWIKVRSVKVLTIVAVSLTVPLIAIMLTMVPSAYMGSPDDNCDKYDNGKLVFTLQGIQLLLVDPAQPFGEEWVLLTVRARARWGNDIHVCRMPFAGEKTKALLKKFGKNRDFTLGRGETTFNFGGRKEKPNVTWAPTIPPFEKDGPPEPSPPEA